MDQDPFSHVYKPLILMSASLNHLSRSTFSGENIVHTNHFLPPSSPIHLYKFHHAVLPHPFPHQCARSPGPDRPTTLQPKPQNVETLLKRSRPLPKIHSRCPFHPSPPLTSTRGASSPLTPPSSNQAPAPPPLHPSSPTPPLRRLHQSQGLHLPRHRPLHLLHQRPMRLRLRRRQLLRRQRPRRHQSLG